MNLHQKEIILNLDILIHKASDKQNSLKLKLIREWFLVWFKYPQSIEHLSSWSEEWTSLLSSESYSFPLPQSVAREVKKSHCTYSISLRGNIFPLKDVRIHEVKKAFTERELIFQQGQLFKSYEASVPVGNKICIVSVSEKKELIVSATEIALIRTAA